MISSTPEAPPPERSESSSAESSSAESSSAESSSAESSSAESSSAESSSAESSSAESSSSPSRPPEPSEQIASADDGGGATLDALVGQVLDGRYQIEAILGEGGRGRVYRATHQRLQRGVAVKVLLDSLQGDDAVARRFEREAQALSALNHPNIVTVTDFGASDGLLYLVMELVAGDDLDTVLEREGALEIHAAVAIIKQVLRALAYAHREGVVHRDLKLSNVHVSRLATGDVHVEVLDFGLARFLDEEPSRGVKLTQAGTVMGTPAYMAPEQANGAVCDARVDVYAVGVMLFELVTGTLPFCHQDTGAMLRAHLFDEPPRLRTLRPDAPVGLETWVSSALSKVPEDRFADGAAMLGALDAVMGTGQGEPQGRSSQRPTVTTARVGRPAASGRLSIGVLAASAATLLSLAGLGFAIQPVVVQKSMPMAIAADVSLDDLEPIDDLPAAADPFSDEATLASELVPLLHQLERPGRRGRLSRRNIGTLRSVSAGQPNDCRPVLLHARAYVAQGWLSQALPLYEEAFRRDASCRGDPVMLRHLVRMAGTETLERQAGAAVLRIYGEDASGDIRRAIADTSGAGLRDAQRRQRWERLLALVE